MLIEFILKFLSVRLNAMKRKIIVWALYFTFDKNKVSHFFVLYCISNKFIIVLSNEVNKKLLA